MIVRTERSGQIEAVDKVDVIVVDRDGSVAFLSGDADRTFFYRSAIKPLQATVSLELGGSMPDEWLAVASSSHGGHPAHVAIVRSILGDAGLDESALGCPPDRPLADAALARLHRAGATTRRRIFHNCSGKHAAWLRACSSQGWRIDAYLDPSHPLQRAIIDLTADVAGRDPEPIGIDGCGAPTLTGSVRSLATVFSVLSAGGRFERPAGAVARFPSLTGDNLRPDGRLAAWWPGPVKVGAQGCIGAGRRGVGFAAKSRSGSSINAVVGIMEAMRRLGTLSDAAMNELQEIVRPPVLGGGHPVGNIVADVDGRPVA